MSKEHASSSIARGSTSRVGGASRSIRNTINELLVGATQQPQEESEDGKETNTNKALG
jgi:hypothetical protein